MQYWILQNDESAPYLVVSDMEVGVALAKVGISPEGVRLLLAEGGRLSFQLGASDDSGSSWDIIVWGGWLRVFSYRAMRFIIKIGGKEEDFFRCEIENRNEFAFLYLPHGICDAINFNKSEFLTTVKYKNKPDIPFSIQKMVLVEGISFEALPPVFFNQVPFHNQVLSELFVNDVFKELWEATGLLGADFKNLEVNSTV